MCLEFFAGVTSKHVELWSWGLIFWPPLEVSEPLVDGCGLLAQIRVILFEIRARVGVLVLNREELRPPRFGERLFLGIFSHLFQRGLQHLQFLVRLDVPEI